MEKKQTGTGDVAPIKELKWMADFLAAHGQPKKALEIYKALVETYSGEQDDANDNSRRDAA